MTTEPMPFDSLEVRKATNGFILIVNDIEGDAHEYVYDTSRKLMKVLKATLVEQKNSGA
jgi:hypothetical protein